MDKLIGLFSEKRYQWLYEICFKTQDIVSRYEKSVDSIIRADESSHLQMLADMQIARLKRYMYNDTYARKKIDHLTYSHIVALVYHIRKYLVELVGTNGMSHEYSNMSKEYDQIIIWEDEVRRFTDFLQEHLYKHLWLGPEGRYIKEYASMYTYPEYVAFLFNNDLDNLFWEWFHMAPGYSWRGIRERIIDYTNTVLLPAFLQEIESITQRREVDKHAFENVQEKTLMTLFSIMN